MMHLDLTTEIYQVVAMIPPGRVATYGQVAALAGYPRHARAVGHALNRLLPDSPLYDGLPWHRVVNAQGRLSLHKCDLAAEQVQRCRLEQENIGFDNNKICLRDYQWQP